MTTPAPPDITQEAATLRELRISKKRTQYDIAESTGIPLPLYRAFEAGKLMLREEQISAVRAVLSDE